MPNLIICIFWAVMWASDDWLSFCAFERTEIIGKTLKTIQGPGTDIGVISQIMDAVSQHGTITAQLLNYTKHGVPFYHTITVEPLVDSAGRTQIFRVHSKDIMSARDVIHNGLAT